MSGRKLANFDLKQTLSERLRAHIQNQIRSKFCLNVGNRPEGIGA